MSHSPPSTSEPSDSGKPPPVGERCRGCLLGVAVGDALGAAFEGAPRVEPGQFQRWADADEALRWTDDTHMTMTLAASLLECGGLDDDHLARRFAEAYRAEPWRGYGAGPPRIFSAMEDGLDWRDAARALFGGDGSFGNGGAMRVAPVGLACHRDLDRAIDFARRSAAVTHAHELGQQAAALQAAAVAQLVSGGGASEWAGPDRFVDELRAAAPAAEFQARLDVLGSLAAASPDEVVAAVGNGITGTEAVPAALAAFLAFPGSFPDVVGRAVTLGGDTDTIASMAGALSGAFLGAAAIPERWVARLEAADELSGLADALADTRASGDRHGRAPSSPPAD